MKLIYKNFHLNKNNQGKQMTEYEINEPHICPLCGWCPEMPQSHAQKSGGKCFPLPCKKTCVLCGKKYKGYGCNPTPLADDGECCKDCDRHVLTARLQQRGKFYELPADLLEDINTKLARVPYIKASSQYFPHGRLYFYEDGVIHTVLLNKEGKSIPSTKMLVVGVFE